MTMNDKHEVLARLLKKHKRLYIEVFYPRGSGWTNRVRKVSSKRSRYEFSNVPKNRQMFDDSCFNYNVIYPDADVIYKMLKYDHASIMRVKYNVYRGWGDKKKFLRSL